MNRVAERPNRKGILFLCVANSSRSQMAEGLARRMGADRVEVHSAGSAPGALNPFAVEAMREIGIDISTHAAKPIDAIDETRIGTVITLCAEEVCPVFPGDVVRLHWPFMDPAAWTGSDEQKLGAFRQVRDAIQEKLKSWLDEVT